MSNLTDELTAVLTEEGVEDADKLEAICTIIYNRSRRCTPEEEKEIWADLCRSAGTDLYAPPKAVGVTVVTSPVDYQRIEEVVVKAVTSSKALDQTRYWSPERAAVECGVSKRTFADWMASGKVKYFKPCRRVLMDPTVLAEDLAKFRRQRMPKHRSQTNK